MHDVVDAACIKNGRDINVKRRTWRNPAGHQSLISQKNSCWKFLFPTPRTSVLAKSKPEALSLDRCILCRQPAPSERRKQRPAGWCRGANRERKVKWRKRKRSDWTANGVSVEASTSTGRPLVKCTYIFLDNRYFIFFFIHDWVRQGSKRRPPLRRQLEPVPICFQRALFQMHV